MLKTKIEVVPGEANSGTIRASFALEDPNGRIIGDEIQTLTFGGDGHSRTIDCEFTITADHGPVVMGDTKEGTFGIRLNKDLSAPAGHMINSHGAEGERAIWGKPADWVDYYRDCFRAPSGYCGFRSSHQLSVSDNMARKSVRPARGESVRASGIHQRSFQRRKLDHCRGSTPQIPLSCSDL